MKKIMLLMAIMVLSFAFGTTANAQTKKIGMEKARQIATQRAAGKIEGEELENENGKTIYSFDIRNSKGTITEVQVDAFTGAIVSVEEENAAAEAAEKRNEKNEKGEMNEQKDEDDESPAVKNARMAKLSKDAKITMEQARAIALKRVPGTITEEDLEKEKGRLQYAFDIKDANGKVFDVEIDAKTGKVLKADADKEDEDKSDNEKNDDN
ncbi:MAG: PepSY domain-containing protein [Acidobacteriota bacterium]